MRKRRTVKFDGESENYIRNLAQNKNFVINVQTAVLMSLCKRGQLSKRQFELCAEKIKGYQNSLRGYEDGVRRK